MGRQTSTRKTQRRTLRDPSLDATIYADAAASAKLATASVISDTPRIALGAFDELWAVNPPPQKGGARMCDIHLRNRNGCDRRYRPNHRRTHAQKNSTSTTATRRGALVKGEMFWSGASLTGISLVRVDSLSGKPRRSRQKDRIASYTD